MYQITPLQYEFDFTPDREDVERFVATPHIDAEISYPFNDKIVAIVYLTYTLHCDFEDKRKAPKTLAFAKCAYNIVKNDNTELEFKSETVFNCVKMLEMEFNKYLLSKKHPTDLGFYGIKPITFQSWSGNNVVGTTFSRN